MANLATLIPFKPGQSGNPGGKPVGARNRLTARFLHELAEHFDEHGAEAIKTVFENKPDRYLMIVAALLPQKFDLSAPLDGMGDDELSRNLEMVQMLRQRLEVRDAHT
jgi:hypothetical protein